MQAWQSTFLGIRQLPKELSAFEMQAFFTFSRPNWISSTRGAQTRTNSVWHYTSGFCDSVSDCSTPNAW